MTSGYVGRFAPSPTGLLHAGSLVAALASWLDARAHDGQWLVRIEDVDRPRCVPHAGEAILNQLAQCGLLPDAPVVWQSQRETVYDSALTRLLAQAAAYPCACSRKDIALAQASAQKHTARHQAVPYPGTCRPDHGGLRGRAPRAWRFDVQWQAATPAASWPPGATAAPPSHPLQTGANTHAQPTAEAKPQVVVPWIDRRLGVQSQDVAQAVGDFVLRRADALWAYQLAVVVDDGAQGVTHVVRGEDLSDNTPRQILLQQALGLPLPRYLHTPLVLAADGEKLSKQNGAQALALDAPLEALNAAAQALGLPAAASHQAVSEALAAWVPSWRAQWGAV